MSISEDNIHLVLRKQAEFGKVVFFFLTFPGHFRLLFASA